MPLASIHLLSLADRSALPKLLSHIRSSPCKPLTISHPKRWIIRPEHIDASALLTPRWDLLLVLEDNPPSQDLVSSLQSTFKIQSHYTQKTGIPSRLTKSFLSETNPKLLHPSSTPPLTGALDNPILNNTSQDLSLSPDLRSWIINNNTDAATGAVSMLNFLAFRPDKKSDYLKYGAAFAGTIGAKRGGTAKLVGNIIHPSTSAPVYGGEEEAKQWDEFALAHYPSLEHFADMLASKDYQEVNQKFRVPSLADTCILCTSEIEVEEILAKESGGKAKL